MPSLDGVLVGHIIIQFDRTLIVGMTSNVCYDDIEIYFQEGIDDVLQKPSTNPYCICQRNIYNT